MFFVYLCLLPSPCLCVFFMSSLCLILPYNLLISILIFLLFLWFIYFLFIFPSLISGSLSPSSYVLVFSCPLSSFISLSSSCLILMFKGRFVHFYINASCVLRVFVSSLSSLCLLCVFFVSSLCPTLLSIYKIKVCQKHTFLYKFTNAQM